jgi:hypothetical protein
MDRMKTIPRRQCALCLEVAQFCVPVCPDCIARRSTHHQHYARVKQLLVAFVRWSEMHEHTWQDDSDGEVTFQELLEQARDLVVEELYHEL